MQEPEEPPRVVEGEIIGPQPKAARPFQKSGILARFALALLLGILSLGTMAVGAVLTLTIVGAVWGIPLLIVGALMALAAGLILFGHGIISK